MSENPWEVSSLFKFAYFCCPECDLKVHKKQDFVNHAFEMHPTRAQALYNIDDVSMKNVVFPNFDDVKSEPMEIKPEIFPEDEDDNLNDNDNSHDDDHNEDDHNDDDHNDEDYYPEADNPFLPLPALDVNTDLKNDFRCRGCHVFFDSADLLREHPCKRNQLAGLGQECPQCGLRFKDLKSHMIKKHKDSFIKCSDCDMKFSSQLKLKKHMRKIHEAQHETEHCLCSLCGKTLIGRSNFKKHEREKHGIDNINRKRNAKPQLIECTKCNTEFETVRLLHDHVVTCQGENKEFPCTKCELTWANGPVLNMHLKKDHQVGEIFTCHICGRSLKRKLSVDSHIKIEHEGKREHVCHLCGTGFPRAQGLKFHIQRVHEKSGRYACEYCDFKTVAQLKLDIHVNEVHTKAVKYPCRECNFFCFRRGGLLAHVKTVHLKIKPHECPVCPEAYVRRKELEKHRAMSGH